MKKALFVGLLFCSFTVSAQLEKAFTSKDSSDVVKLIRDVVALTKNHYSLDTLILRRHFISANYSDGIHHLRIEFSSRKDGGNHDLGIPDTTKYTFVEVAGFYQDVFPFWKKYYQPDADLVSIAKEEHGKVIQTPYLKGTMVSAFNKVDSEWQLENRYSPDPDQNF